MEIPRFIECDVYTTLILQIFMFTKKDRCSLNDVYSGSSAAVIVRGILRCAVSTLSCCAPQLFGVGADQVDHPRRGPERMGSLKSEEFLREYVARQVHRGPAPCVGYVERAQN